MLGGPAGPALSSEPVPLPVPGRPAVEVVARGLDNPRGLAFGLRGELYVAEAGRGGDGPCRPTVEGGSVCSGRSGAITVIELGRQRRVVSGLPSEASPGGTGATGPSDVAVGPDGEPAPVGGPAGRRADGSAGQAPDGPVAVLVTGRGQVVVDAGRNALVRVAPRGRTQTIATFPPRIVDARSGVSVRRTLSSVTAGPDGAWYVGETTGSVEPVARVWRVEPGHEPQVYATGFAGVIDLTWSADGRLHVLEASRLIEVGADGRRRVITPAGLTSPGGLAVRGGYAYLSDCAACKDTGRVLRVRLWPAPG